MNIVKGFKCFNFNYKDMADESKYLKVQIAEVAKVIAEML